MLHRLEPSAPTLGSVSAATPASRAIATAASTFSTLCAPFSPISAHRHHIASDPPALLLDPAHHALPHKRTLLDRTTFVPLNQKTFALARLRRHTSAWPGRPRSAPASPRPPGSRVKIRSFRRRIPLKAPMPIQVVGRQVQDRRNLRTKLHRRLQLKARHLQHIPPSPSVSPAISSITGSPMFPPTCVGQPRIGKDLPHQRSRCRLPVRPRNRHDRSLSDTGSPAQALQSPASPYAITCFDLRRIQRHPG